MLKRALGDIVFAPLTLGDGDTVLDSGTGTGTPTYPFRRRRVRDTRMHCSLLDP